MAHFIWQLFQRDGVFYADGRGNRPHAGKHSLGTRVQREALERLKNLDLRMAVKLGRIPASPILPDNELNIAEGWNRFLTYCERPEVLQGVSTKTHKRYRAVRDKHLHFAATANIRHWAQIDKAHVIRYGESLKSGRNPKKTKYADRTIYLELTLIKGAVKWLIAEHLLPESCRFSLKLRKPQGSDTFCFTPQQVREMINHCQRTPSIHWMSDIILILAMTGLRISELLGLRRRDIDLKAHTLHVADERSSAARQKLGNVRTTKGRRSRRIPIHRDLYGVLERLSNQATGRLIAGPRGGNLKYDTVRTTFIAKVLDALRDQFPTDQGEIGFEHAGLHSFRHFFVSQAFLGGASEGEVKEWVGHRDSRMVELYRHLQEEDSKRKLQGIDFLGSHGDPSGSGLAKSNESPSSIDDKESEVPAASGVAG